MTTHLEQYEKDQQTKPHEQWCDQCNNKLCGVLDEPCKSCEVKRPSGFEMMEG